MVCEGHRVTVITCVPNCSDEVVYEGHRNRLMPQVEEVDGIRVVRVWTYLAPNAGTTRRITNCVRYVLSAVFSGLSVKRPHLFVATSPQFFCGWAGVFASWLKWRPMVREIRDIWPESITVVGAIGSKWLIRVLEWLDRIMYRSAQHIVTVGRRSHMVNSGPIRSPDAESTLLQYSGILGCAVLNRRKRRTGDGVSPLC